ncbi:VOC family protein [Parasphingorhabdus sp.]|uniref:VOC family protein n=1 Tax=Parasphingorhabdus sp. TaxID=2709688 RepID=UPI003BAE74F6
MQLGAFSISLSVKDLEASEQFYEKLGFTHFGGDKSQNWLILKNGDTVIGLFQDMFPDNILTFNPGWNSDAETLKNFTDIRDLQKALKEKGVEFSTEADPDSEGPASFTIIDPDGNAILVDQHVG